MILDNDSFNLMMNKYNMKQPKDTYLIAFNKDDELLVVSRLIKYTKNFLILLTDSIDAVPVRLMNHQYLCNKDNIDRVLERIFKQNETDFDNVSDYTSCLSYIVFVKEAESLQYLYDNYYTRCYNFRFMVSQLKKFSLYDFNFYNYVAIPRLSTFLDYESKPIKMFVNQNIIKIEKTFFGPFLGIGDFFIMYSIIYEYCLNKLHDVYFPIIDFVPIMNSKLYFPDFKKVYFDNEAIYNFCFSVKNEEILNIYSIFEENNYFQNTNKHIVDVVKSILNTDKPKDIYKYNFILSESIFSNINKREKDYIDHLIYNNRFIGMQLFSGVYAEKKGCWKSVTNRNWSEKRIREFVNLCKKQNYQLICLSKLPYEIDNLLCMDEVSVEGYAYAISKLSLVVGIDSSAGHIASFFNIPSITVWGSHMPFGRGNKNVSFRPLRKNISIYSDDPVLLDIDPLYVISIIKGVIQNKYPVDKDIILYNAQSLQEVLIQ